MLFKTQRFATQQVGQRNIVKTLFKTYSEAASDQLIGRFSCVLQERLQEATGDSERCRICIDLIAGMTETQVQRIYERVTGTSSQSSLIDPLN